ncbi:MAG: DUF739 family protein, partial [Lachnospiraceae bacterium]|nr:DUF739 family protein [Lachnospiraceae bacterium]
LGLSTVSLSRKMTGKTPFSQSDIIQWCTLLDIDQRNIGEYFFA